MKRITQFLLCAAVIVGGLQFVLAQPKTDTQAPGAEPYTPTKLEWLALELTAHNPWDSFGRGSDHITKYVQLEQDTIQINVIHIEGADREAMNRTVESARNFVKARAEKHDWHWVKIRETFLKVPAPAGQSERR